MMAERISKKILYVFIYLLAVTSSILSIGYSSAEEKSETIVTTGVATSGQPDSRRNAIEDAMRNAVEEAMGTIVNVELLVENKSIVNEKILSQTEGYIQKYKVNSEEEKGGLYRVQIEADVKLGKVRDDMEAAGLLMKRKQMPRLMVMTMPRTDPQAISPGKQYVDSASGVVEEVFLKKKFSMVDINQHVSKQKLAQASGSRDKLVTLARDTGAELLVLTDAIRYFERNVVLYGSNYDIFRSEIQLRVIETGTGKVIYSGSRQGEPSASMDAVYDASRALANTAIESILQKWSSDVNNATSYKLTISRIDFNSLEELEKQIRNISGVDNLYRRAFDAGQGRFDIEYRGTADDLIKKLTGFKSPGLSITGMSQQTIEAVAR
ncbi:MAG: hypothetical protein BMS9Abin25_0794 [Gammaproteobacteria bacterium]|nr:MAG: hypothetical protein BMS9Abin25_0794 [Gammaproteobacteria bacterium]